MILRKYLSFIIYSLLWGLSASAENSNEKDMARPYLMKVIKKGTDIYVRTNLSAINDIVIKMYHVQNNMTFHTFYVGAKELSDTEITNGSYPIRNIGDIVGAIGVDTFWFLYAQHGWTIPKMTVCGHQLDNNDIGSIWKDQNDRRFIIGKVDGEYIYLLPELTKDANTDVYSASWNGSLQYPTELTHVSGAVHTGVISGSSSRYDLVIQTSQNRKFIADGVEIQDNGEYYCDEFVIKEHIIGHNIGKVQAWFPTPQYNGSLIDFDRCFVFKGSNVTYNVVINTQYPFVLTDYRGCIPQMPLQVGDYHSYTFIPKVKKQVNGHRVDLPFNSDDGTIGANYVSVVRNTTDLYNIDDQPERCITYLKDKSGNYLVGMAGGGSLLRGISTKEYRNVFVPEGKSTCTYGGASTPNKFYPKMLQAAGFTDRIVPNSFTQEFCCYYCWFDPNANEGQVYWYKDGSNYIIYAHCQEAHCDLEINVPDFMEDATLSVVEKTNNTELLSKTIRNGKFMVNYNTSDSNYIVLKAMNPNGDVNGDGEVNAADIVETVNAMDGHPSSKYKAINADMDGNGVVNLADVKAIVKKIMNQIK